MEGVREAYAEVSGECEYFCNRWLVFTCCIAGRFVRKMQGRIKRENKKGSEYAQIPISVRVPGTCPAHWHQEKRPVEPKRSVSEQKDGERKKCCAMGVQHEIDFLCVCV